MDKEPPEIKETSPSTKETLPAFHKMVAKAVAAGYFPPREEPKPLSPEEQAHADEISRANLSAAEQKRLRRQQRNLKLQGLPSGT